MKLIEKFLLFFLFFVFAICSADAQSLRYTRFKLGGEDIQTYGSYQGFAIDQATDALEFVLQSPEAATVTQLRFRYDSRGAGTPVQHKIGIQGVNTSTGRANGTYKTGTGECSATFTPPADSSWDGTWQTVTLTGTTCALTRGEFFSVVISPVGTPTGGNFSYFASHHSDESIDKVLDYAWRVDGGSATRMAFTPPIVWKNGSRTFGHFGYHENSYTQISSDSSPDEVGIKFSIPGPSGDTFNVGGVVFRGRVPSTGKTLTVTLYTGTTVLQDVTIDSDMFSIADGGSNRQFFVYFNETTLSDLSFNTTYRIAVKANETSTDFRIGGIDIQSGLSDINDFYPSGTNVSWTERTDSGSWTDSSLKRANIDLLISDITGGSGGGSSMRSQINGGIN